MVHVAEHVFVDPFMHEGPAHRTMNVWVLDFLILLSLFAFQKLLFKPSAYTFEVVGVSARKIRRCVHTAMANYAVGATRRRFFLDLRNSSGGSSVCELRVGSTDAQGSQVSSCRFFRDSALAFRHEIRPRGDKKTVVMMAVSQKFVVIVQSELELLWKERLWIADPVFELVRFAVSQVMLPGFHNINRPVEETGEKWLDAGARKPFTEYRSEVVTKFFDEFFHFSKEELKDAGRKVVGFYPEVQF